MRRNCAPSSTTGWSASTTRPATMVPAAQPGPVADPAGVAGRNRHGQPAGRLGARTVLAARRRGRGRAAV